MLSFSRYRTTPVIAKGSTYDGITADALAAPSACWDGSRFVLTCSAWNIANGKWYSLFFTSPDLETWTYVAGSIRAPAGGDYILANGSIVWFLGACWFAYNHYPSGSSAHVTLDSSTDLLAWTSRVSSLAGSGDDPHLVVNGTKLELWSTGDVNRHVYFQDSPDGTTWTDYGDVLSPPPWHASASAPFGEAGAFYPGDGSRQILCDVSGGFGRMRGLFSDAAGGTTFTTRGSVFGGDPANAWEASQVFDGHVVGLFNRGDGRGSKLWMLYAGGDNVSATDNTDSSIGLAYLDGPAVAPSTTLFRRGTSRRAGSRSPTI